MNYVMQLVTAFLGSLGFALLFHVRREKLLLASLGGLLAWGVYLLMGYVSPVLDAPRYFAAAVVLTVYGESMARLARCPATLFIVTAAIPLIPGGSLYQTMSYFMAQDNAAAAAQGFYTLVLAVSLAVGMLFPTSIFHLLRQLRNYRAADSVKTGKGGKNGVIGGECDD